MLAIIDGNLGHDAETKQLGGREWLSFNVACTERHKDGSETTTWVEVLYGVVSPKFAEYLHKGAKVYAYGNLSVGAYLSSAGSPRANLTLFADRVKLLNGVSSSSSSSDSAPSNSASSSNSYPASPAPTPATDARNIPTNTTTTATGPADNYQQRTLAGFPGGNTQQPGGPGPDGRTRAGGPDEDDLPF